jgi:tetratricopeptide (TPR) repeat protein
MKTKLNYLAMAALLFALGAGTAWSQATAGKVQGRVTSGGKPVADVQVILTNLDNGRPYKMKTDKSGQFNGVGIAFGNYEQAIQSATGESLYKRKVSVTGEGGGVDDLSVDISQGGTGGGPKMSKEEIERIKSENAKATNINALIKQYMDAINAKNEADKVFENQASALKGKQDQASVDELKSLTDKHTAETEQSWTTAATALKQMVAADPNHWEYYQALGTADLNLKQYQEAVDNYEKGVQLAQAVASGNGPKSGGSAPDPAKAKAGVGQMLAAEGNALLKLNKQKEAIEAYTKAAEMDPHPGTAYFNICATQYNSGNTEGALAACDKAIAADPERADAYFIKGSLLMGSSTMDKAGKLQAAPGTAEALNKYLELAPSGPHANDVKEMLQAIGAKIETTYKERKKK